MTSDVGVRILNHPLDWENVSQEEWVGNDVSLWRHRYDSAVFSLDGGLTHYSLNDPVGSDGHPPIRRSEEVSLSEMVGTSLGAVSVCWTNMGGAGVFDSSRAKEVADALIDWVNMNYEKKEGTSA